MGTANVRALKVEALQKLVAAIKAQGLGSQLQEVLLTEKYLFLQHYIKGLWTLGVELSPNGPTLGFFYDGLPKRKAILKPLVLFLKAHARNLRLTDVWVEESQGRLVFLKYQGGQDQECVIELRLIPRSMNIIVRAEGKTLSLFPVRDLPPSVIQTDSETENTFSLDAYLDDWFQRVVDRPTKGAAPKDVDKGEQKLKKERDKKRALLLKLEGDLEKMNRPWFSVGQYIIEKQTLDVPDDWRDFINPQLPLSANIQVCFEKHKAQEKSRDQVLERLRHLQSEIEELTKKIDSGHWESEQKPVRSLASELLGKAKAKGRKKILAPSVEAVFGKSAQDNVALLRKAQPWDLWLHLKDLPGAHLFIRRPRGKNVDHHHILEAARWYLEQSLGKEKIKEGDRYEILLTECRYVKPIKGDRLGRVTYQNENSFMLRID